MKFSNSDLLAISRVLGDPKYGLTKSELQSALKNCGTSTELSWVDKTQTLHQALKDRQKMDGDRRYILDFLRASMNPNRYKGDRD